MDVFDPVNNSDADIDAASAVKTDVKPQDVWEVILWDDDENAMVVVSAALRQVFNYSAERASTLMLEAHQNGKCAVWCGGRDDAERHVAALTSWMLHATVASS